jgi:hypothetical protein
VSTGGINALQTLYITHLSAAALQTILTHCPALYRVSHGAPVDADFLRTLAASHVKMVAFPGTGVGPTQLLDFDDLTSLIMWEMEPGKERALAALAMRSPGLKVVNLLFQQRPALNLFPDMLQYTPELGELVVKLPEKEEGSDNASDSEEDSELESERVGKGDWPVGGDGVPQHGLRDRGAVKGARTVRVVSLERRGYVQAERPLILFLVHGCDGVHLRW